MSLEKRVKALEGDLLDGFDPELDAELTAWFEANPLFNPLKQPEDLNNRGIPEYLWEAFLARIPHAFKKRGLKYCMTNLHYIVEDLYP